MTTVASLTRFKPTDTPATPATTIVLLSGQHDGGETLESQLVAALSATHLTDTQGLAEWLSQHTGNLWLIAFGHACAPALQLAVQHADRCYGALLVMPQEGSTAPSLLPFPSVVVCPPPDAWLPRFSTSVTLANAWGSRFETLKTQSGSPSQQRQLLEIFQQLRQQNEGWLLGSF